MAQSNPLRLAVPGIPSSFVALVGAAAIYITIGYALALLGPANPDVVGSGFSPSLLPTWVDVHPEPLDRFLFVALTFAAPVVFMGVILVAPRLGGNLTEPTPIFCSLIGIVLAICVVKGAFREIPVLFDGWQWLATGLCILMAWLLAITPDRMHARVNRAACALAAVATLAMIASQRIMTLSSVTYSGGPVTVHHEAVASAAVRIASGQTCLAEVIPQYGCYGEFLGPLLQLTGSSVFAITLIFAVFQVAAVWAVLLFAKSILERPVAVTGCFLALLVATTLNLIYDNPDPILQYFPLRFMFPAFSLLVALWFQQAPSMGRSAVGGAFSGVALAWNLESGIAVAGALALFVAIGNFTSRPWEKGSEIMRSGLRLAAFVAGTGVFLAILIAYLFVKSGLTPDLSSYLLYQNVFYLTGFGMIPIPPFPDYWTIHTSILFCTLLLGALWVASGQRERDPKLELAAFLAILSIGVFIYYSGRSHVLVLRLVAWPSAVLFFFLLDRAASVATRRFGAFLVAAIAVVSCALPGAFLVTAAPAVVHLANTVRPTSSDSNQLVRDDIAFLRSHSSPGEAVAIVALAQSVLYGESELRAALEGPGIVEMIRRVDQDDQIRSLVEGGPDKLFLSTTLVQEYERKKLPTRVDISPESVQRSYEISAIGPNGRLIYLRRKASAANRSSRSPAQD